MEKQPVGLKLDQYFTKEEFIKYIEENITDEDIEQMFENANLTKDTESNQEPQQERNPSHDTKN